MSEENMESEECEGNCIVMAGDESGQLFESEEEAEFIEKK